MLVRFERKVHLCFDGKDNSVQSITASNLSRRPVNARLLPTAKTPTPPAHTATPLLRFIRALNKEQREAVAAACGTTAHYLYQLAADKHPNPRVRLALAICDESRRLSRKIHSPPLELTDLLVGPEEPPPTESH